MTFREFWYLLRTNLALLFVCVSIGALLGFANVARLPKQYTSTTTAYISAGAARSADDLPQKSALERSQAGLIASLVANRGVAQRVVAAQKLNLAPEQIMATVTATASGTEGVVDFTAIGSTPQEAQKIAAALPQATAEESVRLQNATRQQGDPPARFTRALTLTEASLPGAPSAPAYRPVIQRWALYGLVVGWGIVLIRRAVDSRVRTAQVAEAFLGAATVGTLPTSAALEGAQGDPSQRGYAQAEESLRQLRTNLRFMNVDDPVRALVVTSAVPGEGKSTLAAHLARVVAAGGTPTVLVDADLRRHTVAARFGIDGEVGLTQVLTGEVDVAEAMVERDGLLLLPAGRIPPDPSELIGSARMRELIADLTRDHFVVLDAPPVIPVTDAGLLGTQADGVLVVVKNGTSRSEHLQEVRRVMDHLGVPILGMVLNGVKVKGRFGRRSSYEQYAAATKAKEAADQNAVPLLRRGKRSRTGAGTGTDDRAGS